MLVGALACPRVRGYFNYYGFCVLNWFARLPMYMECMLFGCVSLGIPLMLSRVVTLPLVAGCVGAAHLQGGRGFGDILFKGRDLQIDHRRCIVGCLKLAPAQCCMASIRRSLRYPPLLEARHRQMVNRCCEWLTPLTNEQICYCPSGAARLVYGVPT